MHSLDLISNDCSPSLENSDDINSDSRHGAGLATDVEFNFDDAYRRQNTSHSSASTLSFLSQPPSLQRAPLSNLDEISAANAGVVAPRDAQQDSLFGSRIGTRQTPGLGNSTVSIESAAGEMHAEPWLHTGPLTPRSTGRLTSMSPGSAGPASPFSQHTSNPQIAVNDALSSDGFHGLPTNEEFNYQMVKSFPAGQDTFYANYPNYTFNAAVRPRLTATKSRPLSVASSVASDSPATPVEQPEDDRRQKKCSLPGSAQARSHDDRRLQR